MFAEADLEKVKADLERALHRPPGTLRRPIWNRHLKECAREYLQELSGITTTISWEDLKEIAKEELELQEEMQQDFLGLNAGTFDEDFGKDFPDELLEKTLPTGAYVEARAKAISEFMAVLADGRSDVIEFRRRALDGRLLSPEEASTVVDAPEGVSEGLRELGKHLANDYVGWDEQGAIWYVLTGEAPQLRPLKIRGRGKFEKDYRPFQHEVTLSVLPWVPPKEVERAYRKVQGQLLEEIPRETGLRILEVAQFCWEQFRTTGSMPSWRVYCERWNQMHPGKTFEQWRTFRENHIRGSRKALPNYRFPEVKPSFEKQQEIDAAKEHWIKKLQGYRDKYGDLFIEATFD